MSAPRRRTVAGDLAAMYRQIAKQHRRCRARGGWVCPGPCETDNEPDTTVCPNCGRVKP